MQERQARYKAFVTGVELDQRNNLIDSIQACKNFTMFMTQESTRLRQRRLKPKLDDFVKISQIGQGAFGEIHLMRHKFTRQICALKTIPKLHIQRKDQHLQILTERDILSSAKYPHLVKLMYSFQDETSLYLAMEYLPGGDFRTFLNSALPLTLNEVKFYFLEMVFAVSSVHELGYIHRDVKPENFLIDGRGHLKLTDFGLACGNLSQKRIASLQTQFSKDSMAFRLKEYGSRYPHPVSAPTLKPEIKDVPVWSEETVGSVEYMAVEVIQRQPYTNSVDFWSLGCLLFEMFTGKTPFHGNPDMITQWPIVLRHKPRINRPPQNDYLKQHTQVKDDETAEHYYDGVCFGASIPVLQSPHDKSPLSPTLQQYPVFSNNWTVAFLDDVSWDLICHLITSPARRLQTSSQILDHPFFTSMSFENRTTPPFVPSLDHEADCKYFDDFDSPDIQNMYVDIILHRQKVESRLAADPNAKTGYQKKYLGFTFRRQK